MAKMLLVNPRKRRKARKTVSKGKRRISRARKALSSVTRTVKRYRRNPLPKMGGAVNTLKNGAIGAAGAVISEVVLSKLPLPATFSTGTGMAVAKALVGVGVGMAVSKVMKNKSLGKTMAEGAVTIALHDTIRDAVKGPLGLVGNWDSGLLGYDNGLLGYYSAANSYPTPADMGVGVGVGYYEDSTY